MTASVALTRNWYKWPRGLFSGRYCRIGPRPYVQPMRQLVNDHDLPFAADAIPITIGLVVLAVVILVALAVLLWPRSRR